MSDRTRYPVQPRAVAIAVMLACALAAPTTVLAQAAASPADLAKELDALKARIAELERALGAVQAAPKPQWGMTPEQAAEFNRIAVKTEALEDQRDESGFKGLKIHGVMDLPIVWNQNRKTFGPQFLVGTGTDSYSYDSSYMGLAILDIQKEMENGTRYRLTLAPQRGAGAVALGSIVHEASVSVPLTSDKVRLLAGQVPDWSGYEFLPANQNKLVTHNLLFDFTLPTTYTGVGAEITVDKWIIKSLVGAMNASRKGPNNRFPMIAYRGDYARGEFLGFGFAGVHGKAVNFGDANGNDSFLNLFEVDGWYTRGDLSLNGQISYGRQNGAAITLDPVTGGARTATWWGLSALAGYKLTPRLEASARRLPQQQAQRRRPARLRAGRCPQRHRPGPGRRSGGRHQPCGGGPRTQLPVQREHDAQGRVPARPREPAGVRGPGGRPLPQEQQPVRHPGRRELLIPRLPQPSRRAPAGGRAENAGHDLARPHLLA
jgi:hypothetical protein